MEPSAAPARGTRSFSVEGSTSTSTEPSAWSALVGAVEVEFGGGAADRLPTLVKRHGGRRALVVTDPGVRRAADVDDRVAALADRIDDAWIFDEVPENPTTDTVAAGAAFARRHEVDFLVGLGGGSAMDCAKGINFLVSHGGRMEDYHGVDRATGPMLPSVGVPTTAGTGSEAQRFALISRADTHRKMACGAPGARFRAVILDPDLTATVPRSVAVATGVDAVAHAVESFVSRARTPVSAMYSREAWRRLAGALPAALADPADGAARAHMLLGAHLAGAAIEASMLGAAHACANPLTARHGIVHGIAVGAMLPAVVRLNAPVAGDLYAELAAVAGRGDDVATTIGELLAATGRSFRLSDLGVDADDLPALARDAADEWTAGFNPREVDAADLLEVYRRAF